MKRRFSTRDLGLSLRMAVALGGIGLIYLALFAVAGWFVVDAARGGDGRGFLAGPVAHEVAHLANGDGKVMVFAGGPALALSAMWHDDLRSKLWAVLFSPVWLFGLLLMRAVSRYREYAADRGSAMLTGAPEQLMSALVKLHGLTPTGDLRGAATSALCIRSFTRARSALLRDHPPLEKRLARLAEMARVMGTPVGP